MLPDQPLAVQSPVEFLNLYPRPPLLTSLATEWQTIAIACMSQPAYELPESCTSLHGIAISTGSTVVERTIDGITKSELSSPGSMVIVPANVGHSSRWTSEEDMILIGLDPTLFAYAIDDTALGSGELVPQFLTPDPLVYQLGLALKTLLKQNLKGNRLYAETTAAMLAVHLLKNYGDRQLEFKDYTDGMPQSTLRQVIDYIHANLNQELGLAELAAIAHLSPHYFTRLFKRSTGLTPHQFVIRCRVKRAKVLLLTGQDSIAEIAQQVGFANQAHLSVHVKRLLGVTPKTLLQQRKNR